MTRHGCRGLLISLVILGSAPWVHAQQTPSYPANYPQGTNYNGPAYAYPAYPQPMQGMTGPYGNNPYYRPTTMVPQYPQPTPGMNGPYGNNPYYGPTTNYPRYPQPMQGMNRPNGYYPYYPYAPAPGTVTPYPAGNRYPAAGAVSYPAAFQNYPTNSGTNTGSGVAQAQQPVVVDLPETNAAVASPTMASPTMASPALSSPAALSPSPELPPYSCYHCLGMSSPSHCLAVDPPVPFHRPLCEKFWVSGDYVIAFRRPAGLTGPLITSGSAADPIPGALGQPGTSILLGGNLNPQFSQGVRLETGVFLDKDDIFSVEAGGFFVFPRTFNYTVRSDAGGNPVIARPFFSTTDQMDFVEGTSTPGLIAGSTAVSFKSEMLGSEFNGRLHCYWGSRCEADGLVGFRYLRLAETLRINDNLTPLQDNILTFGGNPVNAPNTLSDQDCFQTINQFFGLQVGGRVRYELDWLSMDAFIKAGIGATQQQVNIHGSTNLNTPTGTQALPGGVLALTTNIGNYNRVVFGGMQEVGLNFGVDATKHIRLHLGYSCLIWDAVVRPGNQIDTTLNRTIIPSDQIYAMPLTGASRPVFTFHEDLFWIHTLNFGVEFHF